MCTAPTCNDICSFFTPLVAGYFRATSHPPAFEVERGRRMFMAMDVTDAPDAATESRQFADFLEQAHRIKMTPEELHEAIASSCGFVEAVANWANGVVPNGWVRKIILTNAEMILNERGSYPELSLLAA